MPHERLIRTATWNISGGEGLRPDYMADKLAGNDIIHIQEGHHHPDPRRSTIPQLASLLDMAPLREVVFHESPFNSEYMLSIGTLASKSIARRARTKVMSMPTPLFLSDFDDGTIPKIHSRPAIITSFDGLTIANAHHWPEILQTNSVSNHYRIELEDAYRAVAANRCIISGDLNFDDITTSMPRLVEDFKLQDALPRANPTVDRWSTRPDHIVYTPDLTLVDKDVYSLGSRHNLCTATFAYAKCLRSTIQSYRRLRTIV